MDYVELVKRQREKLYQLDDKSRRAVEALLRYYSGKGYVNMAHMFRHYHSYRKPVATFLSALRLVAIPSPVELLVYRGAGYFETSSLHDRLVDGERVFVYEHPVSTTVDYQVASRFCDRYDCFFGDYAYVVCRLALMIPTNTPIVCLSYPELAEFDEQEIILPPTTRLTVVEIEEYQSDEEEDTLVRELLVETEVEDFYLNTLSADEWDWEWIERVQVELLWV